MRIAVVGAGVAGSYLLNRIPSEHKVECFEMRPKEKWYTVCAWGTSAPYIADMIKKAGFNFNDYILHRGKRMVVDTGGSQFDINLKGLVTYDKHKLVEDMLEGKEVHWGRQVKATNGDFRDFDMVIDATGLQRALLPKLAHDVVIPSVEYQVKSKEFPWDDFYIKPYHGLTGYFWFFPLGDGLGHIGAGDYYGKYRGELEGFLKKYNCETVRKIGRPVRIIPPLYCEPFSSGKVVGVGESIGSVYPLLGEGIIPSMQCADAFVENINNMESYRRDVLGRFAIYSKVYRFVKAKIDGNFSLVKQLPNLLSIFVHMKRNERRYGLQTKLFDILKVVRA